VALTRVAQFKALALPRPYLYLVVDGPGDNDFEILLLELRPAAAPDAIIVCAFLLYFSRVLEKKFFLE
jgi:hypothetical protein